MACLDDVETIGSMGVVCLTVSHIKCLFHLALVYTLSSSFLLEYVALRTCGVSATCLRASMYISRTDRRVRVRATFSNSLILFMPTYLSYTLL